MSNFRRRLFVAYNGAAMSYDYYLFDDGSKALFDDSRLILIRLRKVSGKTKLLFDSNDLIRFNDNKDILI